MKDLTCSQAEALGAMELGGQMKRSFSGRVQGLLVKDKRSSSE